jgi:hypothetical protein
LVVVVTLTVVAALVVVATLTVVQTTAVRREGGKLCAQKSGPRTLPADVTVSVPFIIVLVALAVHLLETWRNTTSGAPASFSDKILRAYSALQDRVVFRPAQASFVDAWIKVAKAGDDAAAADKVREGGRKMGDF